MTLDNLSTVFGVKLGYLIQLTTLKSTELTVKTLVHCSQRKRNLQDLLFYKRARTQLFFFWSVLPILKSRLGTNEQLLKVFTV